MSPTEFVRGALVVTLVVAAYGDIVSRRISNRLSLVVLCCGLSIAATGVPGNGWFAVSAAGSPGFWNALASAAFAGIVLLPLYLLRVTGAGDVKFIAAIAPWLAVPTSPLVMVADWLLHVFIAGGLVALAGLAWHRRFGVAWANASLLGASMFVAPLRDAAREQLVAGTAWRIPFAVAIALGTGFVMFRGLFGLERL